MLREGHALHLSQAFPKQVRMSATALPPGGEAGRRDSTKMPGKVKVRVLSLIYSNLLIT